MIWEDTRHGQVLLLLGSRKVQAAAAAIPKPHRAWDVEGEGEHFQSSPLLKKIYRAPAGILLLQPGFFPKVKRSNFIIKLHG